MLDWIFEGIVTWISSVMTSLMDAIRNTKLHCKVIAYPEQINFLQNCLPPSVEYYGIFIDQVEQGLEVKARSLLDG